MELHLLKLSEEPSYLAESLERLKDQGVKTVEDWEALSPENRLKNPALSRKLIRLFDESIALMRSSQKAAISEPLYLWDGKIFNDDRLFMLDLQPATKGREKVWAVVTRWNQKGFPPYKVNDFTEKIEAIKFLKKIEPQMPRISLGGKSPEETPSYIENLEILKKNGEKSAFAIYEANKHLERTLILEPVQREMGDS